MKASIFVKDWIERKGNASEKWVAFGGLTAHGCLLLKFFYCKSVNTTTCTLVAVIGFYGFYLKRRPKMCSTKTDPIKTREKTRTTMGSLFC
jgi:hypothetical protein